MYTEIYVLVILSATLNNVLQTSIRLSDFIPNILLNALSTSNSRGLVCDCDVSNIFHTMGNKQF